MEKKVDKKGKIAKKIKIKKGKITITVTIGNCMFCTCSSNVYAI